MSEKNQFEIKNPFTVRLSNEEHQIFQESLIDIVPDMEPEDINNRKIQIRLIDLALSKGKKIFVPRPEDAAEIQNLTNEIGRLKILIDLKDEELQRVNLLSQESKELTITLKDELESLRKTPDLRENQVLLTIPSVVCEVLKIEAITAKKKTGKDFTFGDVLLQSFWESVTVGRSYPWRTWSSSEISKIATDLKEQQ